MQWHMFCFGIGAKRTKKLVRIMVHMTRYQMLCKSGTRDRGCKNAFLHLPGCPSPTDSDVNRKVSILWWSPFAWIEFMSSQWDSATGISHTSLCTTRFGWKRGWILGDKGLYSQRDENDPGAEFMSWLMINRKICHVCVLYGYNLMRVIW